MRCKMLFSDVELQTPRIIRFDGNSTNHNVLYFDVEKLVKEKLGQSAQPLQKDYEDKCIPAYVRGMREKFQYKSIISSYLDSPAHSKILETVPVMERPPVLLQIYADDIDRDQTLHSTSNNRIHCTYVRIMNATQFGLRSKDDYNLAMLAKSSTVKEHGYENCQKPFIDNLRALIISGIFVSGKKHAVRVAQLQSDGLERARQIGMKGSFSAVEFIDPFSLITKEDRFNLHPIDAYTKTKETLRTRQMYDASIAQLESSQQISDVYGIVAR